MTTYEKKRNPKFDYTIELNDCTDIGERHRMEAIGSHAQACVYCTVTRPVRQERGW